MHYVVGASIQYFHMRYMCQYKTFGIWHHHLHNLDLWCLQCPPMWQINDACVAMVTVMAVWSCIIVHPMWPLWQMNAACVAMVTVMAVWSCIRVHPTCKECIAAWERDPTVLPGLRWAKRKQIRWEWTDRLDAIRYYLELQAAWFHSFFLEQMFLNYNIFSPGCFIIFLF